MARNSEAPPNRDALILQIREKLLARAGGTVSVEEAADLIGDSAEAIRAKVARRHLLTVPGPGGEPCLPAFQFEGARVIYGLERVLDAMHVREDWMRLQLALDEDVLSALQEHRIDDAVRSVASYLPTDEG